MDSVMELHTTVTSDRSITLTCVDNTAECLGDALFGYSAVMGAYRPFICICFFGYTLIPRLGADEVGLGFLSEHRRGCQSFLCPGGSCGDCSNLEGIRFSEGTFND